ncbi:MAG: M48 family metallopeptidase [archaeon]
MDKYQRIDFRDQISKNKWKSFFLMCIVFIVFVVFGYVISMAMDPGFFFIIMIIAIIFSIGYILVSFYKSDQIAIASVRGKKASRTEHKMFYDLVEGLTLASGMPMPKLYVMESPQINAFASGRDPSHAVICVTTGALEKLEKHELEGVLAHELGHIASYDMRYMTLVAVMVGMIAIISQIFLRSLWFRGGSNDRNKVIFMIIGVILAILAPIVVYLVQMSISRKREFTADASAVKFTRYPPGLIKALKKIKQDNAPPEKKVSKAVAPLFISNPFKGLSSTHPPIDKRISTLERM